MKPSRNQAIPGEKAARKSDRDPVEEFLALPDDEMERIWETYNHPVPPSETRQLNAAEPKQWERMRQKRQAEQRIGKRGKP
jgi:hypothetical protein